MKRFILQIVIFLIPVGLLILPPFVILTLSKESYYDLDKTITANNKYLVGYAYEESNYGYLKWNTLNEQNRNDIVALGSSRVLQFRNNMFETSFYNAGFAISGITDFKTFLQSIPASKYPKYLIIGLDQWMFNKSWDDLKPKPYRRDWKNYMKYPAPTVYKQVYSDLFSGKINLQLFLKNDSLSRVGLNAFVNNRGYRNDGSMYYGNQIENLLKKDPDVNDFEYSDTYKRINNGTDRFKYADNIHKEALKVLEDLLQFCSANNIYMISFLPPFADKVYTKIIESGHYGYFKEIYPSLVPFFKKYGFEVYDFSAMTMVNSSDNETIDGFHGGEVTYLKLLIKMLESGSKLSEVSSLEKLKEDLLNKQNELIVYKY